MIKKLWDKLSKYKKEYRNEVLDLLIVDKSYNRMLRFYRWDRAESRYEVCCDGPDMEKFLNAIPAVIPYNYYLIIIHKDGSCHASINLQNYAFGDNNKPMILKELVKFDYGSRKYVANFTKADIETFLNNNFMKKADN